MIEELSENYGDDLLFIFDSEDTKDGVPLTIIRDGVAIVEGSAMKVMHYSEDFESLVKVKLPTKNRRPKQMISLKRSEEIIKEAAYGILSFTYAGVPYSVGINHVYHEGKIYFHSAKTGFKLNGVHVPVSYLVISDLGINEAKATHNHESVMIQGTMSLVEEETEKLAVLKQLMAEKAPTNDKVISKSMVQGVAIGKIDIHYLHGKSHIR